MVGDRVGGVNVAGGVDVNAVDGAVGIFGQEFSNNVIGDEAIAASDEDRAETGRRHSDLWDSLGF